MNTTTILLSLIYICFLFDVDGTLPIQMNDGSFNVPSYCVNEFFNGMMRTRFPFISSATIIAELMELKSKSASEYFRAHDLLAYQFFMEADNPLRVENCLQADFEFVPLLPFYWRVFTSPQSHNMSTLVNDLVTFMEIEGPKQTTTRPWFSVVSPFNFRTLLGFGMPTPYRKGYVWETISKWTQSLMVGHYERWPQCPDLLRKSWKQVVELPYVPLNHPVVSVAVASDQATTESERIFVNRMRRRFIFFAGRLSDSLFGSEQVCSPRHFAPLLSAHPDVLIINISNTDFNGPLHDKIFAEMTDSDFCMVIKSDSYSSSAVYHAIQAGCVPVIVSDWFVMSFPVFIPYEKFVIRVLENDYLKDPIAAMAEVKREYGSEEQLKIRRELMWKWKDLLSYKPVTTQSIVYTTFQKIVEERLEYLSGSPPKYASTVSMASNAKSDSSLNKSRNQVAVLPFELMLIEMKLTYMQRANLTHAWQNSSAVPCERPLYCTYSGFSLIDTAVRVTHSDSRSHLCQHNGRIIGHYKMVYFMQCVRMLWPLQPGVLRKADYRPQQKAGLSETDYKFVMNFHNISEVAKSGKWKYGPYPPLPMALMQQVHSLNSLLEES